MLKFKFVPVLAGAAALFATTAVLTSASTVANAFAITSGICSSVSPNCGNVTLTQGANNKTVDVAVTLASGVVFAQTGNGVLGGEAFVFSISGQPTITISQTSPSNQTFVLDTGTFDSWGYSISCSTCGNGTSNTTAGPLDFSVSVSGTNTLSPGSFIPNGTDMFGLDLGTGCTGPGDHNSFACNATGFADAEVPAPIIGHGLFVLLAVGGVLFGGKFLEKVKARNLRAA